jgi:hypothetical protein
MYNKLLLSLVAGLTLVSPTLAQANYDEEGPKEEEDRKWIKDTSGIGKSRNGVVRNDQFLELGVGTPSCLQLEGESLLRTGNLEQALTVLQRSVEMAPLDMDKRILYAEALEKYLIRQKPKRDPRLYNFLIKQWVFVSKKAEYADQIAIARGHLGNLTGKMPGRFEKPDKFLAKVLIPEDGSIQVTIGSARKLAAKKTPEQDEISRSGMGNNSGSMPNF